ncbi:MAG: TetR/AcrR family transcriptional regulator [Myxococcota bacterium]|nr:TetR/AcrR family transcriptional regulator [Myxococcota bacterium]
MSSGNADQPSGPSSPPRDPPLSQRERQSLATKDRIFAVALNEIAECGLGAVRIEHIARQAEVTRPTVYAHFPTREDFLRELQRRSESRALDAVVQRLRASEQDHFLHRFVDATIDLLSDANPVLRRETFALMLREPRKEDWMGNALFEFLEEKVALAQSRGEIDATLPASEVTRILTTALFGFFVIESDEPDVRKKEAHKMLDLLIGNRSL